MNPQTRNPKFLIDNQIQKMQRNERDISHQKKLLGILEGRKSDYRSITVSQTHGNLAEFQANYSLFKQKDLQRKQNAKLFKINSENQRMLHNLVKIQQGSSNFSKHKIKPFQVNNQHRQGPKIMKIQEIDNENRLLAQRIMNQKSAISKEGIKQDAQKYLKLKKHMQKVKLPPLQRNQRSHTHNDRLPTKNNQYNNEYNYNVQQSVQNPNFQNDFNTDLNQQNNINTQENNEIKNDSSNNIQNKQYTQE